MVKGYFTIERNILGLSTQEIERVLGFPRGRLTSGAKILALFREPYHDEYEPAGSTLFPQRQGLRLKELIETRFRPGAWVGQRLVKVVPDSPHSVTEWYPPAPLSGAVEQWLLTKLVPAIEVGRLAVGERYYPRRRDANASR